MKLNMYVVIQNSKKMNNIRKYRSFLMLFYFNWKLYKRNIFKNFIDFENDDYYLIKESPGI